jgi:hypothetical protein
VSFREGIEEGIRVYKQANLKGLSGVYCVVRGVFLRLSSTQIGVPV